MIRTDIAIVGGGFSGCLVAAQLARRTDPGYSLHLFEPGDLGRGAAYGTRHPEHLLNTRARTMTAFPDEPGDFVRWLGNRAKPDDFVSRRLYGDYVAQIARHAFERPGFSVVPERVVSITRAGPRRFLLQSSSGEQYESHAVVLATGNAPPGDDFLPEGVRRHPGYVADPWRFDYHSVDGQVLLIGSGLTALDVLVALEACGHKGSVQVVSRRGRFPEAHAVVAAYDVVPAIDITSARTAMASFRQHVRDAARRGFDWRAVVDAIRPECETLWRHLPPTERRRFEYHLRTHWERHRHRAPESVDAVRQRYVRGGRLCAHAGRVRSAEQGRITIALAAGGEVEVRPDWIVNCSGLARSRRVLADPLLARLVGDGTATIEPLGLGVRVDNELTVLDSSGRAIEGLWVVGPLARGSRFEATAVPELRMMAESVAKQAAWCTPAQAVSAGQKGQPF
jgi:uncharacterized NAD(P)/FAD-binding protein YdhS